MHAAEEKQLVLHDRPANDAAKLIALHRIAIARKCIAGIEDSVANELEHTAMELIRARFRHYDNCASRMESILSRYSAGFDFEFLKGIRER